MAPVGSMLWRGLRVYQVYGANTEVGKTVITTTLCRAAALLFEKEKTSYLKPISTGPLGEADDRHISQYAEDVSEATLLQYDLPISPHAAAMAKRKKIPSDRDLLGSIYKHASQKSAEGPGWLFIETAGGVHSPAPTGTTQADLYMPLRCPVILVGDSKLGGISLTISAFESLKLRGYDVDMILIFGDKEHRNYQYLTNYFNKTNNNDEKQDHGIPVVTFAKLPKKKFSSHSKSDRLMMAKYYKEASQSSAARMVLHTLKAKHDARIARLESMAADAHRKIWYPFTQQKMLRPEGITTIDAARGDFFQTLVPPPKVQQGSSEPTAVTGGGNAALLQPSFDGSASWWTQGLGHSNPSLTLAAAYAAGRYGHVMFAEAIHEPALALTEALLEGMQNPRLSRVFFSDNGSTGVEVALKMGLRAARVRYGWDTNTPVSIIGLKGGYHGDTMGAMDCAEPSVYNEKVEWYEGKGVWFDYPTVKCMRGKWVVEVPEEMRKEKDLGLEADKEFGSLAEVFDITEREARNEQESYERYIEKELKRHVDQGRNFGALLMEPVVIGAGGMLLVDPLFQRALVNVVRRSEKLFSRGAISQHGKPGDNKDENAWTGLPVIFDEVFTGLYRLGRFTAASFLQTNADISVHAKLLTGGVVPLCTTLASESIFHAFGSDDKTDALLHGHSYTAHAVGCQVALESLRQLQALDKNGGWDWAKESQPQSKPSEQPGEMTNEEGLSKDAPWSIWSPYFVDGVSRHLRVAGVWALGSVLSIHMNVGDGAAGYKSTAAIQIRDALREPRQKGDSQGTWNVHSRVLGNVLYIMGSQTSVKEDIREIEDLIRERLDNFQS